MPSYFPIVQKAVWIVCLMIVCTLWGRQEVLSSPRSRQAIAGVKPGLQSALDEKNLLWGANIYMRIFKQEKQLEVWLKSDSTFQLFKTYAVCTWGSGTLGPKLRQGDGQAPEGFYTVAPEQLNPSSTFHLSFNLGYPNRYDRAHKRTGSALMVHGDCVSIGCYAMTNEKIEEIYALADAAFRFGQKSFQVHIFPFRMTDGNLQEQTSSTWYDFWENLKTGYDLFAEHGTPPDVQVRDGNYVFESP